MIGDARPADNEDHPQPHCRCCGRMPFTTLVHVGRDLHPDGCLLLCDDCTDFVIEVCDAIATIDDPIEFRMGFADG